MTEQNTLNRWALIAACIGLSLATSCRRIVQGRGAGSDPCVLNAELGDAGASTTDSETVIEERALQVPVRGSSTLMLGQLFAPVAPGLYPAIAIVPGAGAPKKPTAAAQAYAWAGRSLARAGYVALFVVPPEDAPKSADPTGYALALKSAIDCLVTPACNPLHDRTNVTMIGVAGHSHGARASAVVQAEDTRVKAMVAWDNLSTSPVGDEGTGARCDVAPTGTITPRVPAMGQSSETCDKHVDAKKAAWNLWRSRGVPAMQVSFAGFEHSAWARGYTEQCGALIKFYTVAWFDRYLKDDASATQRLLSRRPANVPIEESLGGRYRSSYFDGQLVCEDVAMGCP